MSRRFRLESEITGETCGFDYQTFSWVKLEDYCEEPATEVIIEVPNFHFAHLCPTHADEVLDKLRNEYGYK